MGRVACLIGPPQRDECEQNDAVVDKTSEKVSVKLTGGSSTVRRDSAEKKKKSQAKDKQLLGVSHGK